MKIKIISLLICTLFLTSIFPVLTTAKNLVNINTNVANSNVDLKAESELIKITDKCAVSDLYGNFVVYAGDDQIDRSINIYNIKTGETDNVYMGGNIIFPKISGDKVIFYDFDYMGFKMYNITTGVKTDLIVTNWQGGDADDYQFYGDYIVYENTDYDQYSTEIYLYNIVTGENIQLTDTPGEAFPENPCIYKNNIAWQLTEGPLADVIMYNIETNEYTRVTNTSEFERETFPSIYENEIVYSYFYYDKANGTILYGIKMYDITTSDETTLFTQIDPTGSTPEIFGDKIVYGIFEISLNLYDLNTNDDIPVYEGVYLTRPWNINENYVLFTILNEGVYLYEYNDNNPPDPPEINGPASGKPGISYDYIFNAVDPDGNQVKYFIDWGDGETDTTALNPSGIDVTLSHIWSEKGDYNIKVHAQDEYGSDGLDATFSVTMPRSSTTLGSLFFRILERFPNAFPILRYVLEYSK